ncbi:tyrosine--tRNA ligase, mitochondrial isoform X1 [Microplitis mediator]|uniref:tyrosine--tRNA ligase, mitochondrial isoform X1 n=2 Tax=Microplitis mediator TaxID=375433 RepID=UPI002557780E|nr:tyrosine--tRNA ligase, mitochondrial isoform X1 [Microplitis mediator]XP_057323326.1 tyrosine--tRNA ligase, mitochondrial isoform X1 [Microplitis mediator]
MNGKKFLRLYSAGELILRNEKRLYSSRNILTLHDRGMLHDLFPSTYAPEMKNLLVKQPQCVYAGFDPTADSLHVGNLLVLMNLLHWQRAGHQVIALLGGATGQIGDPSHRASERDEISTLVLGQNVESIRKNIETIFDNHAKYIWKDSGDKMKPPIVLNNLDWYKNLNVIDFIRGVGKYFRMGTMMGRTSVQARLNSETGMSFTEFSYSVFQAYDWLYLFNKYRCSFQIGGNDQMGNIVSGHDLISRTTGKTVYGLTVPLITAEGGKKFGKSIGNAVWLSPERSSSFTFYQFFVRTADADVENFLKYFTFLSLKEIKEIMNKHEQSPDKREAQRILAENVTLLVHGQSGLDEARRSSMILYDTSIESLSKLDSDEVINAFVGAKVSELYPKPGLTSYELAMMINCFKTDRDALRIIPAGGFYINHSKVTNVNEVITPGIHILPNNLTIVRVGKKTYHVVKWLA